MELTFFFAGLYENTALTKLHIWPTFYANIRETHLTFYAEMIEYTLFMFRILCGM